MAARKKTTARKAPATRVKPAAPRASTASKAPSSGDVAAQIQRTHTAVTAAIAAGYTQVQDAMKLAEDAVAQAVHGVTQAVRLAQQSTKGRKRQ